MSQCKYVHQPKDDGWVWFCFKEDGHDGPHRDDEGREDVEWSCPAPSPLPPPASRAELRAEIARLRAALTSIAKHSHESAHDWRETARAALEGK